MMKIGNTISSYLFATIGFILSLLAAMAISIQFFDIKNMSFRDVAVFIFLMIVVSIFFFGIALVVSKKLFFKDDIKMKRFLEISKDFAYLLSLFVTSITTAISNSDSKKEDIDNILMQLSTSSFILLIFAFCLTFYLIFAYKIPNRD